jgi:hypothetical protein
MTVRAFTYDLLRDDPTLNALGYNTSTIFATAPDTPASQRYMVLRWGEVRPQFGRDTTARRRLLTVWAYDREPDYGAIIDALDRVCNLLLPLAGVGHGGNGFIMDVEDNGSSADLYDPAYEAYTRNWAYTITASKS